MIKSFTDLEAWRKGHKLMLGVYSSANNFPKNEVFGLSSQIKRASISITSNIAEGFGRLHKAEKTQFYAIALGSTLETQNQLLAARDLGYISQEKFKELGNVAVEVSKLLQGLIKANKERTLESNI